MCSILFPNALLNRYSIKGELKRFSFFCVEMLISLLISIIYIKYNILFLFLILFTN